MPQLAEQQREFVAALLDPQRPIPAGIVGPDGEASARRFGVYRNNVVAGLSHVLRDVFPAVQRLVGSEFFDAMARDFVRAHPPRSPILLAYGDDFPDFIAAFAPAASVPYLPDVARIEVAWRRAYHAQDATPLAADAFGAIPVHVLPNLRLILHPSLGIVRSAMPALTIWRMNVEDGEPAAVDFEQEGEDALVLRPATLVEARALPPGGAEFIKALGDGGSVLEAAQVAHDCDARFDLGANLTGLLASGAIVAFEMADAARLESLQ